MISYFESQVWESVANLISGIGRKLVLEIQEIFTWAAAQNIWMWRNMLILRLTESFFEPPDDDMNASLGSIQTRLNDGQAIS